MKNSAKNMWLNQPVFLAKYFVETKPVHFFVKNHQTEDFYKKKLNLFCAKF